MQVRLVSQSLGNDQDTLKIFYNLEVMNAQLQILKANVKNDTSVKGRFIPNVDIKISNFLKKINKFKETRSSFESKLKQSAKKGQDTDGTVR